MRFNIIFILLAVTLFSVAPSWASLPYYNGDLGYTIWLADGWREASPSHLSRFHGFQDGVAAQGVGWKAGYTLENSGACLLVSELHGRVVSKVNIGNFNQFVVRELQRQTAEAKRAGHKQLALNKATFDKRKNMLRLEMDAVSPAGEDVTSVVYIVYTSENMLKFVGLAERGDDKSVRAIDAAVSTLYLDYGLRQEDVSLMP